MYSDLSLPEQSGWERDENGEYSVNWDSPEACKQVQETIEFLTKGCSCKKGCQTRQCGCKKKGRHCGPGCECHGCVNLPVDTVEKLASDEDADEEGGSGSDNEEESNPEESDPEEREVLQTEIITGIDEWALVGEDTLL